MENTQPPLWLLIAWNIALPLGFYGIGKLGEWTLIKILDYWASRS